MARPHCFHQYLYNGDSQNVAIERTLRRIDAVCLRTTEQNVVGYRLTTRGGRLHLLRNVPLRVFSVRGRSCHPPFLSCSLLERNRIIPGKFPYTWRNWVIEAELVPAVLSILTSEYIVISAIADLIAIEDTSREVTYILYTLSYTFLFHEGGVRSNRRQGHVYSRMASNYNFQYTRTYAQVALRLDFPPLAR